MLLLLLLLINVYKLSAGEVNESYLVYNELPIPFREITESTKRLKLKKRKSIGCRQTKIPFVMGQDFPEFIHIPRTGGEFISTMGEYYLRALNGSKVKLLWGMKHDWPKQVEEIMMKDDTQHCAPWHRPPHFWWQAQTFKINMPYTSRTFCVVRNPYGRLLSQFNWQRKMNMIQMKRDGRKIEGMSKCIGIKDIGKMIYQNLVEKWKMHDNRLVGGNCHYLPQIEYVLDIDGCRVCDDILVFEELEEQFKALLRMYGFEYLDRAFESVGLPNGSSCPVINILDLRPNMVEIINERYSQDFKKFKYEMIIPN